MNLYTELLKAKCMPISRTTLEGSSKTKKLSLYNDYCQVVNFMSGLPHPFKLSAFISKYFGGIVAGNSSDEVNHEDECWVPGLTGEAPVEDHADLGDMNHQDAGQPVEFNDDDDEDEDGDDEDDDDENRQDW
jgi:hypothetical protein